MADLAHRLAARIARHGPLPFEQFVEAALYDEDDGFYATHGAAGRRGDFLTSPEVGPLFGAVVARALDGWWEDLGRPDPYVVVEAGAGPGTLARAVLAATPACGPALRYVLVERSAAQRARHPAGLPLVAAAQALAGPAGREGEEDDGIDDGSARRGPRRTGVGPLCVSLPDLPAVGVIGVVLANELLDNLPFGLLVNDGGWKEAYVVAERDGRFAEVLLPPRELPADLPDDAPLGARAPLQRAAGDWLRSALDVVALGRVVVIDYMSTTREMARRPWREWLRTYRGHERGSHYLRDVGQQDVTADVALDQLASRRPPDSVDTQRDFLRRCGIDELVDEGRRAWHERAAVGDLAAMRARSRVGESEALLDPSGLGRFTVAQWVVGRA